VVRQGNLPVRAYSLIVSGERRTNRAAAEVVRGGAPVGTPS
jgi:hypothetical protein